MHLSQTWPSQQHLVCAFTRITSLSALFVKAFKARPPSSNFSENTVSQIDHRVKEMFYVI